MIINVNYSVEINDPKLIQKVLNNAEELGYDWGDAGKVETIRRFLVNDGIENVFPIDEIDRNLVQIKGD
jgi:hypothetical protein